MLDNNFEVEILVNGNKVKEYSHEGKVYVEAKHGSRYSIKIKNNSYRRILAVPTVDGLSVLDGKEGSLKSRGYIVDAYSCITIDGWRRSDDEVAEFYFSDKDDAYGARIGKNGNEGIIGVAIFYEKLWKYTSSIKIRDIRPWWNDWLDDSPYIGTITSKIFNLSSHDSTLRGCQSMSSSSINNSSIESSDKNRDSSYNKSTLMEQKVGTGWGSDKTSKVSAVNFDREEYPDSVFEIRYNSKEELEKAGINLSKPPVYTNGGPKAFPGEYCQPPQK